jgi:hypothetical protein
MKRRNSTLLLNAALSTALGLAFAVPVHAQAAETTRTAATRPSGMSYKQAEALVKQHLENFDDLDYNVFTNQKWTELHRSHSKDVLVHWPDGHTTKGIEQHIEDLKSMFVYAPDTRIRIHTVKLGQGEWTAVIGVMEGTFSQPMPIGEGKTIPPTGKPFKLGMATIGHWNKDGVMDEEYLFWDNMTFMNQIGLGK